MQPWLTPLTLSGLSLQQVTWFYWRSILIEAMIKSWNDLKDKQVDDKSLFDTFGKSNGKCILTGINATATLWQSEGEIDFFIECCANELVQQDSIHVHSTKTLITALNSNCQLNCHCDIFNHHFRVIVTIGQDPKDGKGKQMIVP